MIERWFLCKTCDGGFGPRQLQKHDGHEIMKHPTQKPFETVNPLIAASTLEGDLILDPFCGSGTTLVAAMRTGRRAIGIETSKEFCEITVERLKQRNLKFGDVL